MKENGRLFFSSCLLTCLILFTGSDSALGSPAASSARNPTSLGMLLTGVYSDPFVAGEGSEAVQMQNVGEEAVNIAGWGVGDLHGTAIFPDGSAIGPHQKIWMSKSGTEFRRDFGFDPDFEYGGNSSPGVADMVGTAVDLSNDGDVIVLKDRTGHIVDAIPYGTASLPLPDWIGESVRPYAVAGGSTEGQILFRKMRESDGLPVSDSDSARDWGQDSNDAALGKRVQYPGWDVDEFLQPARATESGQIKFCVAPDNLFRCIQNELLAARDAIQLEVYSLDNARIVDLLTDQIRAGVRVTVLLDGDAMEAQGKWACSRVEAAGGQCWLMDAKSVAKIAKRYDNLHAKWAVVDGKRLIISTENLDDDGMPSDNQDDGTSGTRGGAFVTDSSSLVARALEIYARDLDPVSHLDIRRWGTSANDYPPLGFVPRYENGGTGYAVQFRDPFVSSGPYSVELVQCPENCLNQTSGLFNLIRQAGVGDAVMVEQLYEKQYWGGDHGNPISDSNLRLEAYLRAAKRGAKVRILLDSYYDSRSDPRSNYEACQYINSLGVEYSIECRLGNPTGKGLHAKMVLVKHGASGYIHLGSINGSETSSKLNRELAVQVEKADAFEYWQKVFDYDWSVSPLSPHRYFLPILLRR